MSKTHVPAIETWLDSVGVKGEAGRFYLTTESDTREVDRSERTLVVTISTLARDRLGDILDPSGVKVENYRKNPVVLWAHDYKRPPIAKSLWIKIDRERIVAKARFADTPLSREIFSLYADGYLSAWSVGFLPEEYNALKNKSGAFEGYHITGWELLEYSAVPIPTNPSALTNAMKKGLIKSERLMRALTPLTNGAPPQEKEVTLPALEGSSPSKEEKPPRHRSQSREEEPPIDYEKVSGEFMSRLGPRIDAMVTAAFRRRCGKID
jgi:hypothetical protein